MTKPTFREQVQAIMKAHEEASVEFAAADVATHDVSKPLSDIIDRWDRIHEANQRAIAANRRAIAAALELLNTLDVQ